MQIICIPFYNTLVITVLSRIIDGVSWVRFRATWVAVISCWKITGRRLWKRGSTVRCLDHILSTSTSCRVPTSP